jgi:hypothetical protein
LITVKQGFDLGFDLEEQCLEIVLRGSDRSLIGMYFEEINK